MAPAYIPVELRRLVRGDAGARCGYCHTPEAYIRMPLEYDYLYPEALGGPTERENLWLVCTRCNDFKRDRVSGRASETGEELPLLGLCAASPGALTVDPRDLRLLDGDLAGDRLAGSRPPRLASVADHLEEEEMRASNSDPGLAQLRSEGVRAASRNRPEQLQAHRGLTARL